MRLKLNPGQVGVSVEFDESGRWEHPHVRVAVPRAELDSDVRASIVVQPAIQNYLIGRNQIWTCEAPLAIAGKRMVFVARNDGGDLLVNLEAAVS